MNKIDQLKEFSKILLEESSSDDILEKKSKELASFFELLSCVKIPKEVNNEEHYETVLSKGVAVSPKVAASCAVDFLRTSYFLRGIKKAIDDLLSKNIDRPIEILYAGSGPYGTILIPLLPFFSSKEIQVSILDYHEESLASLKSIVNLLDLKDYIKDFIQTDATIYKQSDEKKFDLIISETMAAGLEKEMQVPITLNLISLLDQQNGILIPENILLKGKVLEPKDAFIPMGSTSYWDEGIELGTIFEINKEKALELSKCIDDPYLMANEISFPNDVDKSLRPFLITEIVVYDDIELNGYKSTLNHILALTSSSDLNKPMNYIYDLDNTLGIRIKN